MRSVYHNKYHFVRAALRSAINLSLSSEATPVVTEAQMLDLCLTEVKAHYLLTQEARNESPVRSTAV